MSRPTLAASLFAFVLMTGSAQAADFSISSPDLVDGGTLRAAQLANTFGCAGENVSPSLNWSDAPEGTKSFVVSLYDPDAPTGSGFWHWVMFDIPPIPRPAVGHHGNRRRAARRHPEPGGCRLSGFLGACPPEGQTHRYVLTVTALDVETLGLDADASGALIGFMTRAHSLATASVTVRYGR